MAAATRCRGSSNYHHVIVFKATTVKVVPPPLRRSRLVGWWPMCGGLSEVAVRLKAQAEWQHFHLVGVLGQRKQGCVKKLLMFSCF